MNVWGEEREREEEGSQREPRIELAGLLGNYINAHIREMTRSRFSPELWELGNE